MFDITSPSIPRYPLCVVIRITNNILLTYLMILNDVTARRFIVLYGLIINCSTCVPVAKSNT